MRSPTVSLTAWFKIAEQGMTKYEVLGRCSATCVWASYATPKVSNKLTPWPVDKGYKEADSEYIVAPPAGKLGKSSDLWEEHRPPLLHVVSNLHSIFPFYFPHHYAENWDFLPYIRPENVSCTLELRNAQGMPTACFQLKNRVFAHEDLDLACLHLRPEDAEKIPPELCFHISTETNEGEITIKPETPVHFLGHEIRESMSKDGEDTSLMAPELIHGKVDMFTEFLTPAPVDTHKYPDFDIKDTSKFPSGKTKALVCSSLDDVQLQMGMCGGPIVTLTQPNICLGIVYGVINHTSPVAGELTKDLTNKGKVVSIPACSLANWLYGSIEESIAKSSNAAMDQYKENEKLIEAGKVEKAEHAARAATVDELHAAVTKLRAAKAAKEEAKQAANKEAVQAEEERFDEKDRAPIVDDTGSRTPACDKFSFDNDLDDGTQPVVRRRRRGKKE